MELLTFEYLNGFYLYILFIYIFFQLKYLISIYSTPPAKHFQKIYLTNNSTPNYYNSQRCVRPTKREEIEVLVQASSQIGTPPRFEASIYSFKLSILVWTSSASKSKIKFILLMANVHSNTNMQNHTPNPKLVKILDLNI